MKKTIYFLTFLFLTSCVKQQSNEYAKISGLIENNGAKDIFILGKSGFKKVISVNTDGTFSDTLKILNKGYHSFSDAKNKQALFLKNGDNIEMNYDYNNINNTIKIEGTGAETSNYFVEKRKFESKEKINNYRLFYKLDEDVFNTRIAFLEKEVSKLLSSTKIDSTTKVKELQNYQRFFNKVKKDYQKQHLLATALGAGKPSPKFLNYQNYNGSKTSLDDFKGKYVYIDVWATWCGPCKQQIPYLAKLEKEYHNKNIKFVSISVDEARKNEGSWDKAKAKWKAMIKDKKMGGVQLFADRSFQSDFIKAYKINSIPRFLLIDPNGNIVSSNAPRPSQPALKELLNGLKL